MCCLLARYTFHAHGHCLAVCECLFRRMVSYGATFLSLNLNTLKKTLNFNH